MAIILPVALYYAWRIAPNVSGDLGRLNLVPYGQEYTLNINGMVNEQTDSLCVTQCHDIPTIQRFPIITIGDSFSNQGYYSYPHFLGRDYGFQVGNIERNKFYQPIQDYISLLNAGAFKKGQTVIVEIVEHYYVWRLNWLDFNSKAIPELGPIVQAQWGKDLLSEAARWVRLSIGYNNPVKKFVLDKDCFSHPTRSRELYVYREEMSFLEIHEPQISDAIRNLEELFNLSKEKGINMYFLVCADKYDSYEPWIIGNHPECNILKHLPDDDHIIIMTPHIRELIENGVKDVYQINDGHSSTVGSELCAKVLADAFLNDPEIMHEFADNYLSLQ